LLDWTWLEAVYKALVLLVIACPCALVISTPVTDRQRPGRGRAARHPDQGRHLPGEARKIKAIALDKTGTITEGKPKLVVEVIGTEVDAAPRSTSPPSWRGTRTTRSHAPSPPA
jgi:Cd2+/Zn2+-exporting ATPase